jgi:hypothetical protein
MDKVSMLRVHRWVFKVFRIQQGTNIKSSPATSVPHINIRPRQATQILAIQQTNIKFTQATQVPQTNIKPMEATHFLDMNTILVLATQICTKELKLPSLARTCTKLLGQQETMGFLAMDLWLQSMPNLKLPITRCHTMMAFLRGVLAIMDPMDSSLSVSV